MAYSGGPCGYDLGMWNGADILTGFKNLKMVYFVAQTKGTFGVKSQEVKEAEANLG